ELFQDFQHARAQATPTGPRGLTIVGAKGGQIKEILMTLGSNTNAQAFAAAPPVLPLRFDAFPILEPKEQPSMPLVPDAAAVVDAFKEGPAGLPVMRYQAGETGLPAGSTGGRLLVLRSGVVEVIKDGVPIAEVSTPGAVFGELAVLLDQPHTADVRTLEQSEFDVAEASMLLAN